MPHDIPPSPAITKRELVGRDPHDGAVAFVQGEHVEGEGAAHVGEGAGEAGRAVQQGAGETGEGVEKEVVEEVEEDC